MVYDKIVCLKSKNTKHTNVSNNFSRHVYGDTLQTFSPIFQIQIELGEYNPRRLEKNGKSNRLRIDLEIQRLGNTNLF